MWDFLAGALLVPMGKAIDPALTHAHPDAGAAALAKHRRFRHAETHLLCQIDAVDLRVQRNFEVLRVGGHLLRCCHPRSPKSERFMGNIATETESMECPPFSLQTVRCLGKLN